MKLIALAPLRDRSALWWEARSTREQLTLGVLAGVALVALLLVTVIRPLESARARAASDIRAYDMIAMRLRAAGGAAGPSPRAGPPSEQIAQSAAAAGIGVQRIDPQGGRTNVVLADAPFEAVLRFVADLERNSSLRVREARVERSQIVPGAVSAQILVAG